MPCYHPTKAWRAKREGPDGKRGIVFSPHSASITEPVTVPCGVCFGCRMLYARGWQMRCMHEAQLHLLNCVVTLTYRDERVSLCKRDIQLFMKRVRKFIEPERVSYFISGEYGERTGRPHYHGILFGMDFLDKRIWKQGQGGSQQWVSPKLDELWGLGYATIGAVTPASAAYIAGYVAKKVKQRFEEVDADGVITEREAEFQLMSRRPAIGRRWIDKFVSDVYPDDFVVKDGRETNVPRYYDGRLGVIDPTLFAAVKAERLGAMLSDEAWKNSKPSRLIVREEVAKAKAALQKGTM